MGREAQQEKLGEAQRRGTGIGVRSSIPGRSEVWQASLGRWHSVFGLKVNRVCQETADGSGRQKGSERVSPACTAQVMASMWSSLLFFFLCPPLRGGSPISSKEAGPCRQSKVLHSCLQASGMESLSWLPVFMQQVLLRPQEALVPSQIRVFVVPHHHVDIGWLHTSSWVSSVIPAHLLELQFLFFPPLESSVGLCPGSAPLGESVWALVLPRLWTVCEAELGPVMSCLCDLVSWPVLGEITGSRDQMKCARA